MTEIISLDCSSITGGNFTLPYQFTYDPSLIKLSLNSIKVLLPSYLNEFNRFRE